MTVFSESVRKLMKVTVSPVQLFSPGTIWRVGAKPVQSGTSACPGHPPPPPPAPPSLSPPPSCTDRPPLERGTGWDRTDWAWLCWPPTLANSHTGSRAGLLIIKQTHWSDRMNLEGDKILRYSVIFSERGVSHAGSFITLTRGIGVEVSACVLSPGWSLTLDADQWLEAMDHARLVCYNYDAGWKWEHGNDSGAKVGFKLKITIGLWSNVSGMPKIKAIEQCSEYSTWTKKKRSFFF